MTGTWIPASSATTATRSPATAARRPASSRHPAAPVPATTTRARPTCAMPRVPVLTPPAMPEPCAGRQWACATRRRPAPVSHRTVRPTSRRPRGLHADRQPETATSPRSATAPARRARRTRRRRAVSSLHRRLRRGGELRRREQQLSAGRQGARRDLVRARRLYDRRGLLGWYLLRRHRGHVSPCQTCDPSNGACVVSRRGRAARCR